MRVRKSWDAIEDVLRENKPDVFRCLNPGSSTSALQRFEGRIGLKLPREFRESLMIHDGLRRSYLGPIRLFDYWALLPLSAILKEWRTLMGFGCTLPWQASGPGRAEKIKRGQNWRRGWIPVMDADGDKIVLDLEPAPRGKRGQIFLFRHDGGGANRVLADSYQEWLSTVATDLRKRLDAFDGVVTLLDGAKSARLAPARVRLFV